MSRCGFNQNYAVRRNKIREMSNEELIDLFNEQLPNYDANDRYSFNDIAMIAEEIQCRDFDYSVIGDEKELRIGRRIRYSRSLNMIFLDEE
ncbi:hypothetical protein [Fulvivirga sedimenti]|uniref:Uncharacterized protein n=1 Tax=Fulvivirga sedimenti TaxID=2879465 RepID=A0A9X1L094_9BACT|nr:hypothetical protein [Fulvivirga sedimenti]MCA6075601.1 hypothetical protein [Fulvivirga sedimenti]